MSKNFIRIELIENGSYTHLADVRVSKVVAEKLVNIQMTRLVQSLFYRLLLPMLKRLR